MTNDMRAAFYSSLSKAQSKIEGAKKDTSNPFFKSKYADLASVWDACRTHLTSNGIAVLQFPDFDAESKTVTVETVLTHSAGHRESFRTRIPMGSKIDAQSVGSAITYGRRYALMAAIGIAPEDDDGNSASTESAQPNSNSARSERSSQITKNAKARELYSELQADIASAENMDALQAWHATRRGEIQILPEDWRQELKTQYIDRLQTFDSGVN